MDSVTGRVLFKSWIDDQISKHKKELSDQKEKALVAKAEKVKEELMETSCSYIKITHPPTDLRVIINDKHFFVHFQENCLTIWSMDEPCHESKNTCIRDVLLQEEKTISELPSFLIQFMKEHEFPEDEEQDDVSTVLRNKVPKLH